MPDPKLSRAGTMATRHFIFLLIRFKFILEQIKSRIVKPQTQNNYSSYSYIVLGENRTHYTNGPVKSLHHYIRSLYKIFYNTLQTWRTMNRNYENLSSHPIRIGQSKNMTIRPCTVLYYVVTLIQIHNYKK